MVEPALLRQVLDLPVEDRTELFYELGDSLTADEAELTPELRQLLAERLDDMRTNPADWLPADVSVKQLRERYER